MQFTIGSSELTSAVSYAIKAIPARPAQPIVVGGVVIRASGDQITVTGTDGQGGASSQVRVGAQVQVEGVALVQGKLFAEVCANVKGQVQVTVEDMRLRVRAGKAKFAMPLMPMTDYPAGLADAPSAAGTVETSVLVAAVDQVAVAADPANALQMLQCVNLEFERGHITMAATDRYRLAARRLPWESNLTQSVSLTIPAKVLSALVRGLAKDGEQLTVSFVGSDMLMLEGKSRTAKIGAFDGADFPRWRALIPKSYASIATVDGKDALDTLSRVSIVSGPNDPVELGFTSELISLRAGRSEEESAGADELASSMSGEEMAVLFNPAYLRDGLAACGDGEVTMNLVSPLKPAVLTPVDNPDYTYLVMSVRPSS